jgi:hypothetical protein
MSIVQELFLLVLTSQLTTPYLVSHLVKMVSSPLGVSQSEIKNYFKQTINVASTVHIAKKHQSTRNPEFRYNACDWPHFWWTHIATTLDVFEMKILHAAHVNHVQYPR